MNLQEFSPENEKHLEKAYQLLRFCEGDEKHASQVHRLALQLYDQLDPRLSFPGQARIWLECAAVLHDIGWFQGRKRHHKASLDTILSTPILDFQNKDRIIIGSIARYHRKAIPSQSHDHYAVLSKKEQKVVQELSGILRLANAMDASHSSVVFKIKTKIKNDHITILCYTNEEAVEEKKKSEKNCKLLESACGKPISLVWKITT